MQKGRNSRRGNRRWFFIVMAAVLLAAGIIVLGLRWWALQVWDGPISKEYRERIMYIEPHKNFGAIFRKLEQEKIVAHPDFFYFLVKVRNADRRLRAGEYLIRGDYSYYRLLDILVRGESVKRDNAIPEGFNMREIAVLLAARKIIRDPEAFLAVVSDPNLVKSWGLTGDTLEGYLFPDTYDFLRDMDPQAIAHIMVERFRKIYTEDFHRRSQELGFSDYEILILASIIEKETGVAEERPLISSVMHNRLRKKMRLQSDPTVIYGVEAFDGNLHKSDLRRVTPYNTYRVGGLPPGPITNPGREAILAALYPPETDYLYFVARKDGMHQFSVTFEEHKRAVQIYQLGRGAN